MSLLHKHSSPAVPAAPATPKGGADLGQRTGAINLEKGQQVNLEKTPLITARVSWSSKTDYDVYAIVLFQDGTTKTASQFGTHEDSQFHPAVGGGAVRHMGDVGREAVGDAEEIIEIRLNDSIAAVLVVAYSAQSNGTGSFRRYHVSMGIDNHIGTTVTVSATNANANDKVYTCVPGIIRNTPNGVIIESLELYSRPGSERRPTLHRDGSVTMDSGPTNAYK